MFDDEDSPKSHKESGLKNLEPMSVEELETYIADLEAEIERALEEKKRKAAVKDAASAFFR
jgi:uncharacterized small protein (DUF1192 family)